MIFLYPIHSLKVTWPVRKSEWVLALMTFCMAALLALQPNLFAEQEVYRGMASMAPQWVWQWLCFAIGGGRLVTLFVNGAYWRTPHARAAFAFFNCFVWWQIAAGVAVNAGIGMVVFPGIFVLDVFNFRQAALEAAASEGLRDAERSIRAKH